MTYETIQKKDLSHLKKMECGDIWIDKFGDYILIQQVDKVNARSKTKPFHIFVSAILLTNVLKDPEMYAGQLIDDFVPEFIMSKVA